MQLRQESARAEPREGPGEPAFEVPVLVGWRFLGGQELTLGPRIVSTLVEYNDGWVIEVYAGLSLALSLRLGFFRLIPEVSVLAPWTLDKRSEQLMQVGLGFSPGGS